VDCPAKAALTADEARRMNESPDREHEADTRPRSCEFAEHGPEVRHTMHVQAHYTRPTDAGTHWWLQWSDDGRHEVVIASSCRRLDDGDEACLLIGGHPGDCDPGFIEEPDGTGWVLAWVEEDEDDDDDAWWLLHDGAVFYGTDLARSQADEAKVWAAETLLDFEEFTVTGWAADPAAPDRWTAQASQAPDPTA
jgi:hypothetical protein